MKQPDLETFVAIKPDGDIEIVLDDGSIVVGKDFKKLELEIEMDENLNIWTIKPDDKVGRMVDGYRVMEIKRM